MKRLLCFFALLPSALALPCVWDSDTLAMEMKRFPGLTEVITGRFERNPPLYYQMRLDRVAADVKKTPDRLELYDDAGVACDRLGKGGEAIAWMAKKKAVLDISQDKKHLYRYHANLGTFQAHEWFRSKDRKNLKLLKQGRDHIAKAIEINPDAHFGREKVQLGVLDWTLSRMGPQPHRHEFDSIPVLQDFILAPNGQKLQPQEVAKGLTGLVVLGNAWESVDIYLALSETLFWRDASIASLAALRAEELLNSGRKSLEPDFKLPEGQIGQALTDGGAQVRKDYAMLRREADSWANRREAYMVARLKRGQHPDTDPEFWAAWQDPGPPKPSSSGGLTMLIVGGSASLAILVLGGALVYRRRRLRRLQPQR